jgi:hypothetical protein
MSHFRKLDESQNLPKQILKMNSQSFNQTFKDAPYSIFQIIFEIEEYHIEKSSVFLK